MTAGGSYARHVSWLVATGRSYVLLDDGLGRPAQPGGPRRVAFKTDVGAVWDELSRASNSGGHPGNGLGLALVATIVARHGGTAQMSSRLGVGTSVSVTLPSVHSA